MVHKYYKQWYINTTSKGTYILQARVHTTTSNGTLIIQAMAHKKLQAMVHTYY